MRINNNLMAMNTHRQLGITNGAASKSMEKLSSGYRINRAGDDAAGLAISEKMRGQIRGLNQASRNAQDGISMIQTAEGALNETTSMLQRMRELVVQSNNDTNTSQDLTAIQEEIDQLNSEITRIADKTTFNGKTLLDGSLGIKASNGSNTYASWQAYGVSIEMNGFTSAQTISFSATAAESFIAITVNGTRQEVALGAAVTGSCLTAGTNINFDNLGISLSFSADANITGLDNTTLMSSDDASASFQIGANKDTTLSVSIDSMAATSLGDDQLASGVSDVSVTGTTTFASNLDTIDSAIEAVSTQRGKLGAWQNRLEYTISNLDTSAENLQSAESRVRDVDMAKEMMEFTKNNILQQAAQSMLAQANQAPQGVLSLLR